MSRYLSDIIVSGEPGTLNTSALTYDNGTTGFRNFIINGNMGVYQRSTGAVTTNAAYGPADRWVNFATGDTFSTSLQSFVTGDTLFDSGGAAYYLKCDVTSVANAANYTSIGQRIEDVRLLAGKTVTLSFWAKVTSGTPSIGINITQYFGTGGSTAAVVTGQAQALTTTWTKYTKTFTIPSINGKTIGTEATHYTELNFWLDAGANFNSQADSIGQASKIVWLAQVQLEIGSVATPFEFRSPQTELGLCQRYYECSTNGLHACQWNGYATSGTPQWAAVRFAVTKRVTPSLIVLTNTSAGNFPAAMGTVSGSAIDGFYESRIANGTGQASYYSSSWTASSEL